MKHVKRVILISFLVVLAIQLTGCARMVVDENGIEREEVSSYFISINEYGENGLRSSGATSMVYDPETKIVYVIIIEGNRAGISPYYVINKDGQPEIAIYGVNYKKELK